MSSNFSKTASAAMILIFLVLMSLSIYIASYKMAVINLALAIAFFLTEDFNLAIRLRYKLFGKMGRKQTVYLVYEDVGTWDAHYTQPLECFYSFEAANEYKLGFEAKIREYKQMIAHINDDDMEDDVMRSEIHKFQDATGQDYFYVSEFKECKLITLPLS